MMAAAGRPVILDGTASRDDRAIINYTWVVVPVKGSGLAGEAGGSTTLYGPRPVVTFNLTGTYAVTLKVKASTDEMPA